VLGVWDFRDSVTAAEPQKTSRLSAVMEEQEKSGLSSKIAS
jgi:hypothetical protein